MESNEDNTLNYKEILESTNDLKVEDNSLLVEKALMQNQLWSEKKRN